MTKWLYFVGRPYPHAPKLPAFKAGEYKLGLFLDKDVRIKNLAGYDKILPVDFSSRESILKGLESQQLSVDGLICTYENYVTAKSILAEHFLVASISANSAHLSTDKYLMRQAFQRFDPSITPRFGVADSLKEAIKVAND